MSANDLLDREFAYTTWHDSCRDVHSLVYQCRRPTGHQPPHAAGFGAARVRWDDENRLVAHEDDA